MAVEGWLVRMNCERFSSRTMPSLVVIDEGGIDVHRFTGERIGGVAHVLQQPLHDRMRPAGADVLLPFVDGEAISARAADGIRLEVERDLLGGTAARRIAASDWRRCWSGFVRNPAR